MTNAHVVNHFGQVTVKLYDGTTFYGVVENLDTESDLATVRIKAVSILILILLCFKAIKCVFISLEFRNWQIFMADVYSFDSH